MEEYYTHLDSEAVWKQVKSLQNKERDEIWKFQLNPGIKHSKMTWGE